MNIFKLMQAMRPYIQRGDMTYDLAVKYLKERGVQFDGIIKKALDNMFKKIKARDPVFDKSVTKMSIDDAGTPFNPNTLKSTTEKRGVENLFEETKRVNIPANKLNHQKIAEQAGIDIELIKGKDWVEILEVLKGLNKADGGRIGFRNGGFDYESEAYGAPDTIASITSAPSHIGPTGDDIHGGGPPTPTPTFRPPPPTDDGGNRLNISPVVTFTGPYNDRIKNVGIRSDLGRLMAAGLIDLEDVATTGKIDPTIAANLDLGNFNLGAVRNPEQSGILAQGNIGPVDVSGMYEDLGEYGTSKNIGATTQLGNLGMNVNYDFENNPTVGLSYNNPATGLSGGINYNFEGKPEGMLTLSTKFKKGGRVGFQEGGAYDPRASMQDYAAALKNVSGGRTYQQLDDLKAYARNLASQELAAAGKANRGYTGIYDKYFKGRTGLGGQGFNWGRDTETMNTAHSYNLRDRDQILDDMAGQIMMDQQSYEVQKLNQQRIAEREAAKQRAEQERINAAIKAAYGSPEDYEFQAQLLGGMNPQAYYDYLITGNPKGVDMGAGITTDAYSRSINPYNVYFAEELARQKQMGIPSSQQIQYGQVTRPGGIMMDPAQMNTAQMNQGIIPSMYIPYADAVTLQKQEWDRRFPQGSPKYQTYKSTYPAPDQSTWAPFKQSWGQTYNKGGRVGYANGGLNLSGEAQNIYNSWVNAGHTHQEALDYLSSRGMYGTGSTGSEGIKSVVNTQQSIIPQSGGGGNETWDPNTAQTKMFNKDVWTEISPGLYDWVNTEIEGFLSPTGWKTAQGKNIQHAGLYGIRPMFSYLFDRGAPYRPGGKYKPGSIKGAWQERQDKIKLEQAAAEQQRQETAKQIAAAAQAFQSTGDYDEFSGAGGNVDPGGPASRMDWSDLTDDEGDKYATGGVATMFTRRR